MTDHATKIPVQRIPNGAAIAAYISAMIGLLVLSLSVVLSEISEPMKLWVHGVGKLWMPGADGIGPYSGKETLGLVGWLVSWAILNRVMRMKKLSGGFWLVVFLTGIGVATTLIWPPMWTLIRAEFQP